VDLSACRSGVSGQGDRRKVLRLAQARNELCGGYVFQFEASSERLHRLAELIDAERQCRQKLKLMLWLGQHVSSPMPIRLYLVTSLLALMERAERKLAVPKEKCSEPRRALATAAPLRNYCRNFVFLTCATVCFGLGTRTKPRRLRDIGLFHFETVLPRIGFNFAAMRIGEWI
jgi:hypothetical protein